jgi:hypothetical protein
MTIPSLYRSWLEREDALPIVFMLHHPAARLGLLQQGLDEGADLGVSKPLAGP